MMIRKMMFAVLSAAVLTSAQPALAGNPAPAAATQDTPDYSAEALVGSWLDDDKDVTVFRGDGSFSTIGKEYAATWKPIGEDRYALSITVEGTNIDVVACVHGDTMVMNFMGDTEYFGRYGENGDAAEPDKTQTCE